MDEDFKYILMGGTPRSSNEDDPPVDKITLQTRCGTRIPNYCPDPPTIQQPTLNRLNRSPRWIERSCEGSYPHNYNCAGHVWANRRAAIEVRHWEIVQTILDDDGYRPLAPDDPIEPDDLALYIHTHRLELQHVARVLRDNRPNGGGLRLLSKLGNQFGEVIHEPLDISFGADIPFNIQYWTERSHPRIQW